MRKMLTNALWELVRPHIRPTGRQRCGAKPQIPDRLFLEALLYIARTGCPWRDLPAQFGAWDAVYNRFRRWVAGGRLRKLFEAVTTPNSARSRASSSIPRSCGPTSMPPGPREKKLGRQTRLDELVF